MPSLDRCPDCRRPVLRVIYLRDLSVHPSRGYVTRVALEPAPADDGDITANYAVNVGRTHAHQITDRWPLIDPEKRHHHHNYVCPARRTTGRDWLAETEERHEERTA